MSELKGKRKDGRATKKGQYVPSVGEVGRKKKSTITPQKNKSSASRGTSIQKSTKSTSKKSGVHPRNPHSGRYQFELLCKALPALQKYVISNPKGDDTIDFSNSDAVMHLNMALLAHYYKVDKWQIPAGYLCPPIPGRADYIHYLAELLSDSNSGVIPKGKEVRVLDIGVGANCIYPIIGSQSYGWDFVGADIDPVSVKTATAIAQANPNLKSLVSIRLQKEAHHSFQGIVQKGERFTVSLCNPPFHASLAEANAGTRRKIHNLAKNRKQRAPESTTIQQSQVKDKLNFGGQKAELWCKGGEIAFLRSMVTESSEYANQICWFSSLISKSENVKPLKALLAKIGAVDVKVIPMSQGQKVSRILAWTFLTAEDRKHWFNND